MRTFTIVACITIMAIQPLIATTHIITNSNFTFSPSSITITLGDTVSFVLASVHNAEEVSQSTWNANGNTSIGGFVTPFGGGTVVLQQTGTYYFVCEIHAAMGMKGIIVVTTPTNVKAGNNNSPQMFRLNQNYPNPFNPTTTIEYQLPVDSKIILKVYNILGKVVATLADGISRAGNKTVIWDAENNTNGIYFYELDAVAVNGPRETFREVKRMILLK